MKRDLKLMAAFLVGAALVIFTFWAGGWDFERGPPTALAIIGAFAFGAIFAGAANDLLEDD
jgi:hypothetical protein